MTANDFIDTVLDSKVASEMVKASVENQADDPYKIQGSLTSQDSLAIQEILNEKAASEDISEEDKETISALAAIFGIIYVG